MPAARTQPSADAGRVLTADLPAGYLVVRIEDDWIAQFEGNIRRSVYLGFFKSEELARLACLDHYEGAATL